MSGRTLLIVASAGDEIARRLFSLWEDAGTRLLHPRDLSRPGWKYQPGQVETSVAVADGEPVPAQEISGVLVRLPGISEADLVEISPGERAYVAQEMNAFLVAWLSALKCPVLNRPSGVCLSGPNWRPEQWTYAATQAGVSVVPAQRHVPVRADAPAPASSIVTVVGETPFGTKNRFLRDCARRVARAARVELLTVAFAGHGKDARFLSANPWPDISAPDLALAVHEHLSNGVRAQL